MPKFNVKAPDGSIIQVNAPEGASENDAIAFAADTWRPNPSSNATQPISRTEKYLKGVRDPIDAGAQMLVHALPEGVVKAGNSVNNWISDKTGLVGKLPEGGIDQQISESERKYQEKRIASGEGGFDGYRALGNVVNPVNVSLGVGAGMAGIPASLIGRVGAGSGLGAISSAFQPVTDGDFANEKMKQLGIGAGMGAALPVVGNAASRVINPNVRESVKTLMKNNVTPTLGQIMGGGWQKLEDKMTSIPLLGDAINSSRSKSLDEFNRAAYARALNPIGGNVPQTVGRDAVASVRSQLGDAYDSLLPKLSFTPDAKFSQDMSSLRSLATNLAPQEAKRFDAILNEHLSKMSPNGSMTGETYKIMEGALNKDAKRFSSAIDPYQQELGSALSQTLQTFREGLSRSNPQYAKELGNINSGYANYARIRDAASRQGSADGKFTPSQLAAAVRAQDKTVGKRAYSEGDSLLQDLTDAGKSTLNSQYPDSGTAGRMLASLLAGGGMAGAATVNPLATGVAALSAAPYLPGGRSVIATLLAKRPDLAKPIGELVKNYAPIASPGFTPALNSGNQ